MRPLRLPCFDYTGFHAYSLTFCAFQRRAYFRDELVVRDTFAEILRTSNACAFDICAYCFMPDHVHLLVRGCAATSHLPPFVKVVRQRTAVRFARTCGGRLWQSGYFERTLRNDESVIAAARYIEANPVRAGLARTVDEWPFTGGTFLRPQRLPS
jgi:putative transposase